MPGGDDSGWEHPKAARHPVVADPIQPNPILSVPKPPQNPILPVPKGTQDPHATRPQSCPSPRAGERLAERSLPLQLCDLFIFIFISLFFFLSSFFLYLPVLPNAIAPGSGELVRGASGSFFIHPFWLSAGKKKHKKKPQKPRALGWAEPPRSLAMLHPREQHPSVARVGCPRTRSRPTAGGDPKKIGAVLSRVRAARGGSHLGPSRGVPGEANGVTVG